MALIDQQEAAKLIRQNKDTHEDCQGAIHYNIGCEHSAQIVEQMKGQEIIRCHECKHNPLKEWFGCPMAHLNSRQRPEDAWFWRGERKAE